MSSASFEGRFVWYQLNTTEPDAAAAFYRRVAGWAPRAWEGGEEPYILLMDDDQPVAGVMTLPDEAAEQGAAPHWLAYVGTADVDRTAQRAGELGGEVLVPPSDIPDVGRFAVLRDPQGAVIAVHRPRQPPEGGGPDGRAGRFSWHELATSDHRAALEFYGELFGWEETEAQDMGPVGVYRMYGRSGTSLGGMYDRFQGDDAPPAWLYYITVVDLDGVVERVTEEGGTVENGPMEVPGGDRVAQCLDPQGAAFALHAPAMD